jgi:hypothetical protein
MVYVSGRIAELESGMAKYIAVLEALHCPALASTTSASCGAGLRACMLCAGEVPCYGWPDLTCI